MLTVYIPSRNRRILAYQQRAYAESLGAAVIISDNHSDEPYDRARRLPANIGSDLNIALGFLTDTEWLWILSDDDTTSYVPDLETDADLIYMSKGASGVFTMGPAEILGVLDDGLGLISRTIYRAEKFSARDALNGAYTGFSHLCAILAAANRSPLKVEVVHADFTEGTCGVYDEPYQSNWGMPFICDFFDDCPEKTEWLKKWWHEVPECTPWQRARLEAFYAHHGLKGESCKD